MANSGEHPEQAEDNPASNVLPHHLSFDSLRDAIEVSGYPLQARAVDIVGDFFNAPAGAAVLEEWSYLDSDNGQRRAIDVRCEVLLADSSDRVRVRPILDLLLECKQPDLPWVFFVRPGSAHAVGLPRIAGLPSEQVAIVDQAGEVHVLPVLQAIGAIGQRFILSAAPTASSFARVRRKGSRLELTGDEAWSTLTVPLLKAADHLHSVATPSRTWRWFDARLIVPVAVLDAPIVAVDTTNPGEVHVRLAPWVRVERHDTLTGADFYRRPPLSVLDVVHVDYLAEYLRSVKEFSEAFARGVVKHHMVLATSRGVDTSPSRGFDEKSLKPASDFHGAQWLRLRASDLGWRAATAVIPLLRRPKSLVEVWPARRVKPRSGG